MRTIIELPEDQLEALDGICRRESISRAEAIRRAVDLLVYPAGGMTCPPTLETRLTDERGESFGAPRHILHRRDVRVLSAG